MKNKKETSKQEVEKKKKVIIKIFATILIAIMLFIIALIANNYMIFDKYKTTNLVINNNNITRYLKNEVLLEDNVLYLSKADIQNFFDKYIYEEDNKIITTYGKKIAEIGFEENNIVINGSTKRIHAHAIKKDDKIYLPISEMTEVYDIEIENIENSKVITMDSLDREQKRAIINSNTAVKSTNKFLSKTVDRIKKGETAVVINTEGKYTKIRTTNGKIGYVKSKKLENEFKVRENMLEEKQIDGKINLVWDYYSEYVSAPNRKGTKIEGINVVSPSFFYIDKNGKLQDNIGIEGKAYIEWAHENGYKVWPMISNAMAATESLSITSKIVNNYELRNQLIESIVAKCVRYKLDGINIDFENMKESDKNMFSRFIIELTPRMKEAGLVTSVDVTAPDGAETWSLCFDRNVIGDVADYIVFMAYDEYGVSSTKPGTTAGYDWVELSLNKFLTTEDIDSEKIILAVPFYTRIWTIDDNEEFAGKSSVLSIKNIDKVIPENAEKQWDDKLKQYVVQYEQDGKKKKVWLEDAKSLEEKLSLVNDKELAGVGAWKLDMETEEIWKLINKKINQ